MYYFNNTISTFSRSTERQNS